MTPGSPTPGSPAGEGAGDKRRDHLVTFELLDRHAVQLGALWAEELRVQTLIAMHQTQLRTIQRTIAEVLGKMEREAKRGATSDE